MTYDEILRTLTSSDRDDYEQIQPGSHGHVAVYRKDVALRIERMSNGKPFDEQWALRLSRNRTASSIQYRVWYGSSPIRDAFLVALDSESCLMPMPLSATERVVRKAEYAMAAIMNFGGGSTFQELFGRSGLGIAED